MRLWLDDLRRMPADFDRHVKTAAEAIALLATGLVTHVSLDHDLGWVYVEPAGIDDLIATAKGLTSSEETGHTVAQWIERAAFNGTIPPLTWAVHSANPVGRKNIIAAMQAADRYWKR